MSRSLHAFVSGEAEPGPVMNTTPLIDLMLVLLVMFIVSIPIATHEVPLDLPTSPAPPSEPVRVHRLALDASGQLFWNGEAIPDAALPPLLARVAADPAEPELHITADGETRYERVDETLVVVLRAGITRMGFVGNERFARMMDGPAHE